MRLLGLDFGLKKVGVALFLDDWPKPLAVWSNDQQLFSQINKIAMAEGIEKIVVGLPEGAMEKEVRSFGQKLAQTLDLPVEFSSECLTTDDAIDKMLKSGRKRRYRRKMEDAVAAALILENYLEKKHV